MLLLEFHPNVVGSTECRQKEHVVAGLTRHYLTLSEVLAASL